MQTRFLSPGSAPARCWAPLTLLLLLLRWLLRRFSPRTELCFAVPWSVNLSSVVLNLTSAVTPSCLPEEWSRKQNLPGMSCHTTEESRKRICGLRECPGFRKLGQAPVLVWLRGLWGLRHARAARLGGVGRGCGPWSGRSFCTPAGVSASPWASFRGGKAQAEFSWRKSFPADAYSLWRTSPPRSWA